jgi:hypothetical protein
VRVRGFSAASGRFVAWSLCSASVRGRFGSPVVLPSDSLGRFGVAVELVLPLLEAITFVTPTASRRDRQNLGLPRWWWLRSKKLRACAIVRTMFEASRRSAWPREMKKLAPSRPYSCKRSQSVRAIVDLPMPARPFSQKTQGPSEAAAQNRRFSKRDTRVPGVHMEVVESESETEKSVAVEFHAAEATGRRESSNASGSRESRRACDEEGVLTDVSISLITFRNSLYFLRCAV